MQKNIQIFYQDLLKIIQKQHSVRKDSNTETALSDETMNLLNKDSEQ